MINVTMKSEDPQSLCVRILAHLILQRNPTLTQPQAREIALAAVLSALTHRETAGSKP